MKRATLPDGATTQPTDPDASTVDRLLTAEERGTLAAKSRLDLEEALRRERSLLRTIIESLPAHIYAKDMESRFIACNATVAQCMGTTPREAIGKTDFDFYPREMAAGFFADEQALIRSGEALIEREEKVLDQTTGIMRYFATNKVPFRDDAGNIIGIIGIGRDITERKRADERIRFLASHDSLTELPNRATFSEALTSALTEARARDGRFAILFVDLDHFKFVNDSLGHEAGDSLLKQTAARLRASVRADDIVARLGGDEFVLLCKDPADLEDIEALASRVLQAAIRPVTLLGHERRVSASIGVAVYPDDGDTERVLMKSADTAMYTAKQEGKNTYRLFSRRLRAESLERAMLESELRQSIERNELVVHYLPKLDLKTRVITGAEALLRWSRPDLGVLPPSKFLPLAEETGLIVPIGMWVLKTVCRQHMAWRSTGLPPIQISVNLTARQFHDEHFVPGVLAALMESGMPAQMLELELSETLLLQNTARVTSILKQLRRAGVKVAVDNFGATYLSLATIKEFPIDTLKVDRSLLRDIDQAETRAFTDAIIAMGKSMNLAVVAEGIENATQAEFARERACDAIQGFYVSRPAAAAEFGKLLRRQGEPQD
ncbi:MAG TPA: EAL domain-containing protein [Steroidobacteraceae bacterium]|nr:EAL domain-containing protein [Steroidobacteraceae bacterium]